MTVRKNSNTNEQDQGIMESKLNAQVIHLEKQKLIKAENEVFENDGYDYDPNILDFDLTHSPPNAVLIPEFNFELKFHQLQGIHFLYKACIGTLEKFRQGDLGSGAILAHCMGLGKTFESIAFISAIFAHTELRQKISKVLIIVPPKLIEKWESEFKKFCHDPIISVQSLIASRDKDKKRLQIVQKWYNSSTPVVLIIGTILFRDAKDELKTYLQNPDMVFYDEAHQGLKDVKTITFQVFNTIAPKRRILLTGTPSPNDLVDYYTLIHLVNPDLLGTKEEFDEKFKSPIVRGSYKKATKADIEYMERLCAELKEKVKDTVDFQSKEYEKQDFILKVSLTKAQKILYADYLDRKNPDTGNKEKRYCLADFHVFNHLLTHPWLLIRDRENIDKVKEWWTSDDLVTDADKFKTEMSNKIGVLTEIIKYCEMVGDKLLIFSHSKIALNFIEEVLTHLGKNKKWFVNGHNPVSSGEWGWETEKDYFKINGDVPFPQRETYRKNFAKEKRARVMLITKQSDGVGVDILAANRVVIFDIHWNPAVDEQAIFRVCREGQKKPIFVYRFVTEGTMEGCIYNRQIVKASTSKRVHTNAKIQNWFTQDELKDLYAFCTTEKPFINPHDVEEKSLRHIVKNCPNAITNIHSQDYLLRDIKNE